MTALELLTDLRQRGAKLWVDGPNLRFSAPKGALGFGATELLARHKGELVRLLQSARESDSPPRQRAGASQGFSLDNQVIALSSVRNWRPEEQVPYVRYVAPYRGFLYQQLGLDKTYVRGEGCYLFDADENRYADFVAQFGAVPFGHDPAPIWNALDNVRRESQPNLAIGSISSAAGQLAEQLLAVAPPGLGHVVFTNSGAESVEIAIKLARCRTGRTGILSARNGFHGLTLAGMSATDKEFFQRGFGAPVTGFNYVPFGDVAALEATLAMRPDFFAAFIVEIVQGESGIHVAPSGYLAAALDLCHRFGALLIVDEVQTGLGRTGKLFACESEGITPDILALAKALGGGLISIGACLYTRAVYTEQFDLRHGSTFAGNTLACRAALATVDQLIKDDQRLVRQVAAVGQRLMEQLRQLQNEYPMLIRDVRGRGLMLGVELNLKPIAETQKGLLAVLQQQGLLFHMAASFLLNAERVRVAASFNEATVLRIEPPLIADTALCDQLIRALKRLLDVLQAGDAGELLGHFMGISRSPRLSEERGPNRHALSRSPVVRQKYNEGEGTRFAFVMHLIGIGDLRRFDPSLEPFGDGELEGLKSRMADFVKPFPVGELCVRSVDGSLAEGEMITLPHLPAELLALSGNEAVDVVQSAVDLAADRGAKVIGLGGFSSIIVDGGLALRSPEGVSVTSGNSLTTWAAIRAVESACAEQGLAFADCTVAIVGATGTIGQGLSMLCAERAAELILVGNPRAADASIGKLREVAHDCKRHVAHLSAGGREFSPGTFAERTLRQTLSIVPADDDQAGVTVTTDIDKHLPRAHIVLTATNAVLPFISAPHLRKSALVCDVSRPFNLAPDLADKRPDLRLVSGGLVRAPQASILGDLEERDQPNTLVACAAETIVLALSRYRAKQLCGRLNVTTIQELGSLAERIGFSVAD